jgi:segregation and condensation protein B
VSQTKSIIEALIFASESPLSLRQISEILSDIDRDTITHAVNELMTEYGIRMGGFELLMVAGGFQFRTRADLSQWIKKLYRVKPQLLTLSAMETLAVIAYRQPVLKSEIDKIRGVDSGSSLRRLIQKRLVKIMGRKDVPGKPILYGTAKRFLEVFNLKDLSELPTLRELDDFDK